MSYNHIKSLFLFFFKLHYLHFYSKEFVLKKPVYFYGGQFVILKYKKGYVLQKNSKRNSDLVDLTTQLLFLAPVGALTLWSTP